MPLTAILSILHRISGVALFIGTPILLWMLGKSLTSAAEFQSLVAMLEDNIFYKLIFIGILTALGYHIIAGVKHLFMDMGIGESEQGGKIGSRLVLISALLLILLMGAQL